MFENAYKHYIRIDAKGYVIKAFSDAFEQPQEGDILVAETEERHYNPELFTMVGAPRYKWSEGQMVETPGNEQWGWIIAHTPVLTSLEQLQATDTRMARVAEDIYDALKAAGFTFPSAVDDLIAERKVHRAKITTK